MNLFIRIWIGVCSIYGLKYELIQNFIYNLYIVYLITFDFNKYIIVGDIEIYFTIQNLIT